MSLGDKTLLSTNKHLLHAPVARIHTLSVFRGNFFTVFHLFHHLTCLLMRVSLRDVSPFDFWAVAVWFWQEFVLFLLTCSCAHDCICLYNRAFCQARKCTLTVWLKLKWLEREIITFTQLSRTTHLHTKTYEMFWKYARHIFSSQKSAFTAEKVSECFKITWFGLQRCLCKENAHSDTRIFSHL